MRLESTFTGFIDRGDAGRRLGKAMRHHRGRPGTIVVALPCGGVVTAAELAEELDLPLDVLVVGRLASARYDDVPIGAIGAGGVRVLDDAAISLCGVTPEEIEEATARARIELEHREHILRDDLPPLAVAGLDVILVDDGIATGTTMSAAITLLRRQKVARIILAVPVAPIEACYRLSRTVDELICLETPETFLSVGRWYREFSEVSEGEVLRALERARARVAEPVMAAAAT